MLESDVHLMKALLPIDVRVAGRETDFRDVQPENVLGSIQVTPSGTVKAVSFVQPENAASSMVSSFSGSVNEPREVHPENAPPPIALMLPTQEQLNVLSSYDHPPQV